MIIDNLKSILTEKTKLPVFLIGDDENIESKPFILLQSSKDFYDKTLGVLDVKITVSITGKNRAECLSFENAIYLSIATLLENEFVDYITQESEDLEVTNDDALYTLVFSVLTRKD